MRDEEQPVLLRTRDLLSEMAPGEFFGLSRLVRNQRSSTDENKRARRAF